MAVNIARDNRQVNSLFWMTAICISLKGALYTFRRYVTIAGQPLPDQGVGSHEEAFLFVAFVLLLFVLSIVADPAHKALRNLPVAHPAGRDPGQSRDEPACRNGRADYRLTHINGRRVPGLPTVGAA
jgi:hypothetical protein